MILSNKCMSILQHSRFLRTANVDLIPYHEQRSGEVIRPII